MAGDDDDFIIEEEAPDFVRPFLVTAGRTETDVEGLQFETLVETQDLPADSLRYEPARIFEMCRSATGIAEISAQLGIPLATVKVVVGDLIQSGHVKIYETIDNQDDAGLALMNRIMEGVRKL